MVVGIAPDDSSVFDERNRLVTGPDGAYSYTARGTLESVGAVPYSFDALGRMVDYDSQASFTYDGLDRVASRNTDSGWNVPSLSEERSSSKNATTPRRSTLCRVTASTPAVRAPGLPATRSHATTMVARSQTKLNKSPNRLCGSDLAHRCSLR